MKGEGKIIKIGDEFFELLEIITVTSGSSLVSSATGSIIPPSGSINPVSGYITMKRVEYGSTMRVIEDKTTEENKTVERLGYIEDRQKALESVSTDFHIDTEKRLQKIEGNLYNNFNEERKLFNENWQTLYEISLLQDNWNDNGAEKFNSKLIKKCMDIIASVYLKYQPKIYPTGRDSIQFEYEPDNNHYLEIEVFNDRTKIYKRINDAIIKNDNISEKELIKEINDFQSRYSK